MRNCLLFILSFVLCSAVAVKATPTILVDGSSTVFPISEGIAEDFQINNPQLRVAVASSGTGGGFKKFCKGEVDIVGASRPIEHTELELCSKAAIDFIELPIAYDGLAIVVNPQNTWAKSLTVEELKKIWEPASKVKTWQDVRAEFPALPINLYGPGPDSGTFDYFTKVINHKEKASRSDFSASESDFVIVKGVSGDKGALGYFGFAYYLANKSHLNLVGVDAGQGVVMPSEQAIATGIYRPLSRPIFIYVSKRSLVRDEVKNFSRFFVSNAERISSEVGYVGLGESVYKQVLNRLETQQLGSIFALESGVSPVSVAETLKRFPLPTKR